LIWALVRFCVVVLMKDAGDLVVDDPTTGTEGLALAGHTGKAMILRGPDVRAELHGFADAGHGLLLEIVGDDGLRSGDR